MLIWLGQNGFWKKKSESLVNMSKSKRNIHYSKNFPDVALLWATA